MRSKKEIKDRIKHLKGHIKQYPDYIFRGSVSERIRTLEWVLGTRSAL